MKVFISWSGARAKHVATALRSWLPKVLQAVEPWMSEEDILAGSRWERSLGESLESADFGIICLTPESINQPMVLFESGAISKSMEQGMVCPYLIDLEPEKLQMPMSQFNAVRADKQGTLRLLRSLNGQLDWQLSEELLSVSFERWWEDLEKELDELDPSPPGLSVGFTGESSLGLQYIFENRGPALQQFKEYLEEEVEGADSKESPCISLIGTSARGFLFSALVGFEGEAFLEQVVKSACKLRIMLVHPVVASLRELSERRDRGFIARDILTSLVQLKKSNVPTECVRYYMSGPTAFGIATSDWMLLNPYPAAHESQSVFTLVVKNTDSSRDIYLAYKKFHFDNLWDLARPVPEPHWQGSGSKAEGAILADVDELQDILLREYQKKKKAPSPGRKAKRRR